MYRTNSIVIGHNAAYRLEENIWARRTQIYKAVNTNTLETVAVKIFPHTIEGSPSRYCAREAKALLELKGQPGIIDIKDTLAGEPGIVMEYFDSYNLFDALKTLSALPDKKLTMALLGYVAAVLEKIHSQERVHGDIKPYNILMQTDKVSDLRGNWQGLLTPGAIKLIDLEFSHSYDDLNTEGICGSPKYMSPEQTDSLFSIQSDMWAWHALAWRLVLGRTPVTEFHPVGPSDFIIAVARLEKTGTRPLPPDIIPELEDLIFQAGAGNPDYRPPPGEAVDRIGKILKVDFRKLLSA